jgi:hypothetical protein
MQPHRIGRYWSIFYAIFGVILIVILIIIAAHIGTHTVPVGKVYIATPYSKYVVGEPISYTLTNGYDAPVYITSQCPSEPIAVYQSTSSGWNRIHATATIQTCNNQPSEVTLEPGKTATTSLSPWQSLFASPGKYRLVAIVDNYTLLPYVDIEIIAKPSPNIIKILAPTPKRVVAPTPTYTPTQTFTGTEQGDD